jgi:hypothetical protein
MRSTASLTDEPRQIPFLQGGEQRFRVLTDDVEIAFIFGVP